jgi:RNA polymerase sigma factor (sigma-70 family)
MALRIPGTLTRIDSLADDRELVRRFAEAHDDAAFAGIVARHARMVLGVCRRAVGDAHLAEDAFQAVFLVLARNPRQAQAARSVGGWLFGIARRVSLAARRHETRRSRLHSTVPLTVAMPRNDFDDLLLVLDEEMGTLPDAYRAPLVACFLQERTQDEAARELGWSLSTLRRRLERGKELLRTRLLHRGVTLAAGLFASALGSPARCAVPSSLLARTSSGAGSECARRLAAEVISGTCHTKVALAAMALAASLGGLAIGYTPGQVPASVPASGLSAEPSMVVHPQRMPAVAARKAKQPDWVTVTGRVVVPGSGPLPRPEPVDPRQVKDVDFFAPLETLSRGDMEIDAKTRGIGNAVVWLRPDSTNPRLQFPSERIHPDFSSAGPAEHAVRLGRDGFRPRVLAVREGDRVVFHNPTPIPFNVHYFRTDGVDGRPHPHDFNILLASDTNFATSPLTPWHQPDLIRDAIHSWMRGCVWTFTHPYFAVTDESGRFKMPRVPVGNWRMVVWHEKPGYRMPEGRIGKTITVTSPSSGDLDLEVVPLESPIWTNERAGR